MSDAAFSTLTRGHGRRAPESTFTEVTDRISRWLLAVEAAGLADAFDEAVHDAGVTLPFHELRSLTEPARAACRAAAAPSAAFGELLARLETRLGAALPPSLVGFWELRERSPEWRSLVGALVRPRIFEPSCYLDHDLGAAYRLSIAVTRNSMSPVHETLEDEYVEWFAETDEAKRATAATWRDFAVGDSVMLDPEIRYSLIEIGSDHGEWVEVVSDWRDGSGESPIFRAGDDYEGDADLLATTVPEWLGLEIDVTLARLTRYDDFRMVASGAAALAGQNWK
ncbi:hypothetical protein [Virgisporangium aurantiacum]|uniref:Uncharacterized protein n=1 Tax=Virgisporangium aurantiacum TaxID=175570 RepID=A0A8J3Z3S8_9ACTN|nr:hypothetical protein [Virgisporangium aurantiacum]GIJ56789.1 hypothetical protein Vau01_043050 [Virgisporangium aurantiacum]